MSVQDNLRLPRYFKIHLNLSTVASLGTEESGCCREVRSFVIWAPHSRVLYSVDISVKYGNHANATAAVPSHFNQPGHSITDMELILLE